MPVVLPEETKNLMIKALQGPRFPDSDKGMLQMPQPPTFRQTDSGDPVLNDNALRLLELLKKKDAFETFRNNDAPMEQPQDMYPSSPFFNEAFPDWKRQT